MKKPSGEFGQIPKGLPWRCKNRPKSTLPRDFLGIFGISKGGKGTLDHRTRKKNHSTFDFLINPDNFVLLNIF
jgi:hypothetical protein